MRAKALAFAVVAPRLGCPFSEGEAKHLLGVGGMSAAAIEEVRAHLGSRALDTLEALVVPLRGWAQSRATERGVVTVHVRFVTPPPMKRY